MANGTNKSKGAARRWGLRLAGLVVIGGLGIVAWRTLGGAEPPPLPPTTTVSRATVQETVLANGTLEAIKMVSVGAQVSGQIKTLYVAIGDQVKAGDPIAAIDDMTQQNNLLKAQAELENVKAQRAAQEATLRQADLEYKRQKTMLARKASSQQDYEAAQADWLAAKASVAALDAQIAQAEIAVDTAKVDLGYTKIVAPLDGTVVAVPVKEGQTVNAAQSTPTIVKVAQLGKMTIKAEISEADVVRVKPGQKITFTILGAPDTQYSATLRTIEPGPTSYSEETSTSSSSSSTSSTASAIYYNGLFDVDNPDGILRIDMTAEVSIILNQVEDALVVPASALGDRQADGRYPVTVISPQGQPEQRLVTVGINNNVSVQIIDGLSEGDRVVSTDELAASASGGDSRRRPRGPMGF
jgi:macrolide-specific efflux system membrane fusion protein